MSSPDVQSAPEPYKWTLPEDAKAVALNELREDEALREQALQQMREWIEKHPKIKNCRTDAPFLLRYLRTKKFSVPQACALLERYLTVRQLYPRWFQKLDVNDPDLQEIFDSGYIVVLPARDAHNRIVFMSNAGKFDPHKYTSDQMARAHSIIVEAYLDDELNQVYGYTYVNDEAGLSMSHLSLWSLTDLKTLVHCIQNTAPVRHKETHFVNFPSIAGKFLDLVKNMLSEKLRNRIIMHKSEEELRQALPAAVLPKEYGGEVPLADIIRSMKAHLAAKREEILALDGMSIEIDPNFTLDGDMRDELGTGISGSFRKLEVD